MSSLSDWENTKENIIPLKTGRDPTKLESFAKSNQSNEELEKEKEKFETIISEYKGEDPIDNWLKFIKWVQQSYPGGNMKEQLIILLERCTRLFISTERYKNDPRYLRIWIAYADMCRDPIDVFSFLENHRIGSYLSLIYEARAIVYENKGDYEKADKAFKQGIERNAQPITRLQQKHQDFERRLMARLKHLQQNQIETTGSSSEVNDENQSSSSSSRVTRSVLGTISSTSVSSERKSQQIKGAPLGSSVLDKKRKVGEQQKAGQFQIYSDDAGQGESEVLTDSKFFGASRKQQQGQGGALQPVKWDELEPELTKHKENTQISQKWTDVKVIQKKQKTSNPTGFQIYCDDEFKNHENNNNNNNENSSPDKLKLHTKQQTKLEQIQNNPLANFPKSSSSTSTTSAPSKSSSSSSSSSSVKNERIGYNKSLFIIDQQHEISFEEYRASIMKKKIEQQLKLEKERFEQEERKRIDEEQQQAKLKLELEREEQEAKELLKKKEEKLEKEQQYQKQQQKQYQQRQQQQFNPPSPTMTIHTKQALNDVMAMFSEPLEFEKKSNSFNNNNNNNKTNTSIPSSPNPFSPKVIDQQQPLPPTTTTISTDIEFKDSSFNEELVEDQENLDPNYNNNTNNTNNPLLSSKITNRDILKKQLSTITDLPLQESVQQHQQQQQQEFITLDQDRDVVQTMERIDFYVKKEAATKFNIYQDSSALPPSSNGNQFSKSHSLADKIAGKNKQPLQQSVATAFTIFQDDNNNNNDQPQQQQSQQQKNDGAFSFFQETTQKSIFTNTNSGDSTPVFTMYEDEKQQQTTSTTIGEISSLSLSTISSKSMVFMDFSNTSSDNLDSNTGSTGKSQITGNITSLIDPTAIIEVSLTPSDGIVNPYFAEHMYILEQHVSSTVQSIETFHNVGDDLAPIPEEFLDQFNLGQVYYVEGEEDQRVGIDLSGCKFKFTKCIARSAVDGSFTYKVERIPDDDQDGDDDALMSGMMSTEGNILTCKVQEPQSIWEFYICDQIQLRLQKQQPLSYCANKFPMKQSLYYYTDKSILLMEHLDEGTLVDVIECSMQMDEPLAMFHCIELLRMVSNLHSVNIIHGNICPINLVYVFGETLNWPDWSIDGYRAGGWKSKSFCLSDFSKSIDTTIYGNGSRFQSFSEYLPFDTPLEWISKHDTWTYNIDYLGIAKVLFYILTSGKEELKLSINQTTSDDTITTTLYITNLDSIRKDFENSTLWINLLNSLLNHDGKIGGDGDSNNDPLKLHREIFENYLHLNPMKSKSLKSTIRRQNHKLFELIKSK